jgi:oligopeptide transport system ATP-binding protein
MPALLEIRGLCKTRTQGRWWQRRFEVRALDHVDLTLDAGRTLALVGESGAGKTTLAMCLVGLEQPDAGEIRLDGKNMLDGNRKERARRTLDIQLIFQDSAGALSPRLSAAEIIEEPLLIRKRGNRRERREAALEAMNQVGLSPALKDRRANEMSGGQRQRIAIARALVTEPRLLILDEALAGLDLSIQGQIMNLLLDLQAAKALSYLYISHNLQLVKHVADEVVVLHRGRVIEHTNLNADSSTVDVSATDRSATNHQSLAAQSGA